MKSTHPLDIINSERHAGQAIKRPKLLFLACFFPPVRASGCIRTWNIAKYLSRLGWQVTVVTPDLSFWLHVDHSDKVTMELEREGIDRIFTGHRWRCLEPSHFKGWNHGMGWVAGGICRRIARHLGIDNNAGWIGEAERACARLTAEQVDVVLACGTPFSSFTLAERLSRRLGRPYVLDYRDPWIMPDSGNRRARVVIAKVEADLVRASSGVTAVSQSFFNGRSGFESKTHVITNGFDPEEMALVKGHDFGHFAIVYAGIFEHPVRTITPVMQVLRRLSEVERRQHLPTWRFHYYGPQGDHVREEAQRFGVMGRVVLHGKVARSEALSAIRGSNVTVVITSVRDESDTDDRWRVTGKLFDALGLGVPILLIGQQGSEAEIIANSSGLAHSVRPSDLEGMESFLRKVMAGNTLEATTPEMFAWPNIIKKMDLVLRNAISVERLPEAVSHHRFIDG